MPWEMWSYSFIIHSNLITSVTYKAWNTLSKIYSSEYNAIKYFIQLATILQKEWTLNWTLFLKKNDIALYFPALSTE